MARAGRGALDWVAVDPAFEKAMKKRARQVMPKTMKALEKHAKLLREEVATNWPVKSGKSKAAFKIAVQTTSKGPRFIIANDATNPDKRGRPVHYVMFVRFGERIRTEEAGKARKAQRRTSKGRFGKSLAGKFAIRELLFKPAMKARKAILADIAGELTA